MYKFFCMGNVCDFELWSCSVVPKLKCKCGYLTTYKEIKEASDFI
jgi:hypothetical protein